MTGPEFTALRKAASLSAKAVAEAMEKHVTTLSRWETEALAIPQMAALALRWLHHEATRGAEQPAPQSARRALRRLEKPRAALNAARHEPRRIDGRTKI